MRTVSNLQNEMLKLDQARFGLCMFVPAVIAEIANRQLNRAYGDEGDSLNMPMRRRDAVGHISYFASNYQAAPIDHALKTVEIFESLPGGVLLITEEGVTRSRTRRVISLVEHGAPSSRRLEAQSFQTFASGLLGLEPVSFEFEVASNPRLSSLSLSGLVLSGGASAEVIFCQTWSELLQELTRHPDRLFEFARAPRRFEEFIAETYAREGYRVELTPRSGDGGVDIIAERPGFGAVKILDQTKALSEGRPVIANDVRALVGTLATNPNASKAILTTTSVFAPGVPAEFSSLTPTRLELRDGEATMRWINSVAKRPWSSG